MNKGKVVLQCSVAVKMVQLVVSKKNKLIIVPADATSNSDLDNLIDETMKHFNGKIDLFALLGCQ